MILSEKFNLQNFTDWIEKFLPELSLDLRKVDVPNGLSDVKSIQTLGESNIGVRIFVIETERDPSGRKIGLAKESFNIIKNYGTPNALIAYYSEDSSKWRLSLLTSTAEWSEGKIITKLSNPKRQSYVLGPHSKVNTPTRFLLKKDSVTDVADLKSRFSLEVVNKEFYKEISESFIKLIGGTQGTGRNQKKYDAVLKLPSIADHSQTSIEFAVRLIGRIIFCWFLREKKSSDSTSLMPKELVSLEAINNHSDYYHQVLEPIFFEVLNQQVKARKDPFYNKPYSLIPYLNGGLFSPHEDDFYKRNNSDFQSQFHNTLVIPDEWFVELFKTLETYNFTIDENTSFDEELSIDPEMLGRIFENLLAEINPETGESARKSTGSYYTPRVIVDYMIDESLLLYLKQQTEIEESKIRAIISYDLTDDTKHPLNENEKQKAIDALQKIKILDPACGSGAFPIGALQKMVFILQQIDPDGQSWFRKQLENADPEFRRDIERRFTAREYDYIRKLGLIRKCIYGVDIQPIATEISRLRCFLTLIVDQNVNDELENRGIRSLPNLEFKFVTANTLVSLPKREQHQQSLIDDYDQIDELKAIRDLYFDSTGAEREMHKANFYNKQTKIFKDLRREHGWAGLTKAALTDKLTDWDPFSHRVSLWFDPEWMFGVKEGFDIVIANPPYIGEKHHKGLFDEVKSGNLHVFYNGQMDYFYFFFHLGLNLSKEKGVTSFITTNYYPTARGAKKLRKDFKQRAVINLLINFNELKIFESAKGQHNMITILQKDTNENAIARTCIAQSKGVARDELLYQVLNRQDDNTQYFNILQRDLYDGEELYVRTGGTSELQDDLTNKILNRLKSTGQTLDDLCNVNVGLYTGADKVTNNHITKYSLSNEAGEGIFVLTNDEVDNLMLNEFEQSRIVPFYKNSDIHKWFTSINKNLSLIKISYPDIKDIDLKKIPNLFRHLHKYEQILKNRKSNDNGLRAVIKSGFWWTFTIRQIDFSQPKIVVPQRSPRNTFGYNEVPWYASADVYFITVKNRSLSLKYILALLNSQLYYFWLYHRGKRKGETLELYQKPLSEIPIKKISPDEQKQYVKVIDKILDITKSNDYLENFEKQGQVKEYEIQIDQLVYKLYNLTSEEIAIVNEKI